MTNIFVFTGSRKIIFEKERDLPNGFVEAKKWLNSRTLDGGGFECFACHASAVRPATNQEADDYITLKDHSLYTLNADKNSQP